MVRIKTYRDFWRSAAVLYPAIKSTVLVSKEDELAGKIKNMSMEQFPALISVIPSADGQGRNVDAVTDKHTGLIYILKKFDSSSQTDDTIINDLEETQDILENIKKHLLSHASISGDVFYRLDISSIHTDPEYNYLGCHGWSLGFNF